MKDIEWRLKLSTRKDGIIVSTIETPCLAWYGKYETAISFGERNDWRICKGYETKEEALKGHEEILNLKSHEIEHYKFIG